MFHFLGFLFLLVLIVLVSGLILLSSIIRSLLGFGRRSTTNDIPHNKRKRTPPHNGTQVHESTHKRKKIFDKDEGEYVDFEEVTDK